MNFFFIAAGTFALGIALRAVARSWDRRCPPTPAPTYNNMSAARDELRNGMLSLRNDNPDLPTIPPNQALYEFWFAEAKATIATNVKRRSRESEVKLASLEVEYERQKLAYFETKHKQKEILELSDLDIEAKRQERLFQIEDSKVKREALRDPTKRPSPYENGIEL